MATSADLGISDQPTHDAFDWLNLAANEGLAIYQTATQKPITAVIGDRPTPIPAGGASNSLTAILAKPTSIALIVAAILAIVLLFAFRK